MSKPAVADTEPFPFRSTLRNTVWEAIKGWDIRRSGEPGYHGATGNDADIICKAITDAYVGTLEESGTTGQHYLAMRGELIQAHSELDQVSIERSEEGAVKSLPERVAILAGSRNWML